MSESERDPAERASYYVSEFTAAVRAAIWPDNFKKMRGHEPLFLASKKSAFGCIYYLNTALAWVKKMLQIK